MANDCLPQAQACAIRVARLEPNGVPDPGPNNLVVSDSLIKLTATPVYKDGAEIEVENACGTVCVNLVAPDSLKRWDVELEICTQDPELMELLGGGDVLTVGSGGNTAKGYAFPPIGVVGGNGVSIELWTKRIDDGDIDADWPYGWWVLPKVKNIKHGPRTFENGALITTISGKAYQNDNWFDGPLNDWEVASDRALQWVPTTSIPASTCGYRTIAAS